MNSDGTFKVEIAFAPDNKHDPRPWRARIHYGDSEALADTVWGSTRETALVHARQWIKTRNEHGEPETVLLDRNGDIVPAGFSEKVAR